MLSIIAGVVALGVTGVMGYLFVRQGTLEAVGADRVGKYKAGQDQLRARRERISNVRLVSNDDDVQQQPGRNIKLVTRWFSERSDAEEAARTLAVDRYDVDVVWHVNTVSRHGFGLSQNGPTYFYSEWRVEGVI
ncbi:hypothetical protein [Pantoea sp. Cy-639]|jgi:hypothetical protein|uniref:hypothetical protein n=1 Tax=Pantoea sp. Cy-639 TaxID=2608360 RepID=UPI001420732B|nr:hypothetical protein [Pantoea sp. Cy-639]NIF18170.1 hypothetical protein [Pantoea sp. Cy-639]